MMRKIENDVAAFIRSVARERGRNADWGEKAVRQSVSATEREALKLQIIDLVADNLPDLLAKIDGREVKAAAGTVTLRTRGAVVWPVEIGWRDRFLAIITDPRPPSAPSGITPPRTGTRPVKNTLDGRSFHIRFTPSGPPAPRSPLQPIVPTGLPQITSSRGGLRTIRRQLPAAWGPGNPVTKSGISSLLTTESFPEPELMVLARCLESYPKNCPATWLGAVKAL
jgi:hypothetical protein